MTMTMTAASAAAFIHSYAPLIEPFGPHLQAPVRYGRFRLLVDGDEVTDGFAIIGSGHALTRPTQGESYRFEEWGSVGTPLMRTTVHEGSVEVLTSASCLFEHGLLDRAAVERIIRSALQEYLVHPVTHHAPAAMRMRPS